MLSLQPDEHNFTLSHYDDKDDYNHGRVSLPCFLLKIIISDLEDPLCESGVYPLVIDDDYLPCPEEGAPCPRAGYTCQTASNNHMYCCPIPEEVTTEYPTTKKRGKQSLAKIFKGMSIDKEENGMLFQK